MPTHEEAAAAAGDGPGADVGANPTEQPAVDLKGAELEKAVKEAQEAGKLTDLPSNATADDKRAALAAAGEDPTLKDAQEQLKKDNEARTENPHQPVIREANPAYGGESFSYGS